MRMAENLQYFYFLETEEKPQMTPSRVQQISVQRGASYLVGIQCVRLTDYYV